MSDELKCPRCDAPFWHFTAVNTRTFECGSDAQIASMGCKYASQLRQRIKRLEDAGDTMASAYRQIYYDAYDDQQIDNWTKAKEQKP